jgi:hypothetical protein
MTTYWITLASLCIARFAAAQPGMAEDAPSEPAPEPPAPEAAPQPSQPPPGSTQATFLSTSSRPWEVLVDRSPACQTPCSIWVPPARFITFRSIGDRAPVLLEVGYLPPSPTIVQGKPLENGKYAAGVTFTTLSGMGLVTGVTLLAVGYGTGSDGMMTAGLITGIPCALGLYLSIRLMQSAVPEARIGPAQPYVAGNTVGLAGSF